VHKMWRIATYITFSVACVTVCLFVCLSVCLSGYWSCRCAVQKRMNWSRCHWGVGVGLTLLGPRNRC